MRTKFNFFGIGFAHDSICNYLIIFIKSFKAFESLKKTAKY